MDLTIGSLLLYGLPLVGVLALYSWRRASSQRVHAEQLAASSEAGLIEPASLHPVVDPDRCLGSGLCTRACPEQALGVVNGKAVLVNASACEKPALAVAMMKRLEWMLKEEGVTYEKPVLAKVIEKFFPDFRRTINELQRYANFSAIDSGVLTQIDNVVKFDELFKLLKAKKFNDILKWINTNPDVDADTFYSQVFKMISPYVKPESMPVVVLLSDNFQTKNAVAADPSITMIAFLTEVMTNVEWR